MKQRDELTATPWAVAIRDAHNADCPAELKRVFEAANAQANALMLRAWIGPDQVKACKQLILLAEVLCLNVRQLWDKRRDVLAEAVRGRPSLPLSLTKDDNTELHKHAVAMLRGLPLQTERRSRGTRKPTGSTAAASNEKAIRAAVALLRREIKLFVQAVREPGTIVLFRYVESLHPVTKETVRRREERDAIDPDWRKRLLSGNGRKHRDWWRDEFRGYVKAWRPDLLASDGKSGALACLLLRAKKIHSRELTRDAAFERYVEDAFRTPLKVLLSP